MNEKNTNLKSFDNENEAIESLKSSREKIDEIDENLVDLISKRNSLANDILMSKVFLNMDVYDENREKAIYKKISKLAIEKNINENILIQIMSILTDLSKNQQKKILRRIENGKY